jgi:PAB1-binding protein PBP1
MKFHELVSKNLKELKKQLPDIPHKLRFKKAVELSKKMHKPKHEKKHKTKHGKKHKTKHGKKHKTFRVGKKGTKSMTRKGRKNFETHEGDEVFHEDHHNVHKKRKPYQQSKKKKLVK